MKNKNYGQTLVEVLIALGAATLIISAIVIMVISALNNAQFTKNQNLATHFAQEGIEIVKNLAQSNWSSFSTKNSNYCLDQNSTVLTPKGIGCVQNVDIFVREVDIAQNSVSCSSNALVTVLVSWSDSKCTDPLNLYCHQVNLTSCLTNNTGIRAP